MNLHLDFSTLLQVCLGAAIIGHIRWTAKATASLATLVKGQEAHKEALHEHSTQDSENFKALRDDVRALRHVG